MNASTAAPTTADSRPTSPSTWPSAERLCAAERRSRAERTCEITEALRACREEQERLHLTNLLATVNMEVADSVVSRYRNRGIATDDLQQAAYLALTKAARRFDPASGHDFLSYCVPTIRGEIRRHFRDKGWVVRPPRRIQELQQRVWRAQDELAMRLGRPADVGEIARHLDESPTDVREAMAGQGCFSPDSLDRTVNDEGSTALGEMLSVEDRGQDAVDARVALAPVVRRLSDRDRHILQLRFFDGLTQREIADDLGVTQMQVSRLLTRIFRDLRNGLGSLDAELAA